MTRDQHTSGGRSLEELVAEDQDLLREALQAVLEGEMEECLQAKKGERTPQRLGYRSGHYERTLVTRVGKPELRVPPHQRWSVMAQVRL